MSRQIIKPARAEVVAKACKHRKARGKKRCETGEMISTGQLGRPGQLLHRCDGCGEEEYFNRAFPYERIVEGGR